MQKRKIQHSSTWTLNKILWNRAKLTIRALHSEWSLLPYNWLRPIYKMYRTGGYDTRLSKMFPEIIWSWAKIILFVHEWPDQTISSGLTKKNMASKRITKYENDIAKNKSYYLFKKVSFFQMSWTIWPHSKSCPCQETNWRTRFSSKTAIVLVTYQI